MIPSAEPEVPPHPLLKRYGPLIGSTHLRKILGFATAGAFRQAVSSGRVPIRVFALPGRRGKFAWTADVAAWLQRVSEQSDA